MSTLSVADKLILQFHTTYPSNLSADNEHSLTEGISATCRLAAECEESWTAQVSADNASHRLGWSSVCRSGTSSLCLSDLQNVHTCQNITDIKQHQHEITQIPQQHEWNSIYNMNNQLWWYGIAGFNITLDILTYDKSLRRRSSHPITWMM